MDWTTRMNIAMDYIEANLDGDIDLQHAARLALCTYNNFSYMFLITTGIQVSEYIRRRRMTLAAIELQSSEHKIIDIALKYGYSSPTAFTRAFQSQHKVSPQYARSRRIPLVTYPRFRLQINLQGEHEMKARIEKKPAFTVVGVKKPFRNDAEENHIPAFWSETPQETYNTLRSIANGQPEGFIGLCTDFDGLHSFNYYIAVATTEQAPEGFSVYTVPAATWVILEQEGDLMELNTRFWQEWLPSSGYQRADETIPDVEVYPQADLPKENFMYELWFPVVKK